VESSNEAKARVLNKTNGNRAAMASSNDALELDPI
jgi:hypothetical protein